MAENINPSQSIESIESETLDSLTESEQDTSNSLGNLNIQTAAKRSCSEGDMNFEDEQTAKWRCIRDEDDSNSNRNSNNINDQNDNNNCNLVTNQRIFNFVKDPNSAELKNINSGETLGDVSQHILSATNYSESNLEDDSPYKSHVGCNRICAVEYDTEGQRSHVNCLPHMIMTRIFSYLSLPDLLRKAGLVCRYWRNVAYDPVLWRNIFLKSHPKVGDRTLLGLIQLSQNVNLLDITDSKFVTSRGMIKVLKHCRWLTTLKLVR